MVVTQVDDVADCTHVIVQANRSMSWRANVMLIALMTLVSFGIALAFAMVGLWVVLPFAGLEMLALAGGLYWTMRRLGRREVITFSASEVRLATGYRFPEVTRSFPRHWVRIEYDCSDSPFDTGSLVLRVHDQRHRVGECLGREEKLKLATELRRLL